MNNNNINHSTPQLSSRRYNYLKGDHLVFRGAFGNLKLFHHGIYVGNGMVVHFWGPKGKKYNAKVKLTTIDEFEKAARSRGQSVQIVLHSQRLPRETTVKRCLDRVGQSKYHLFNNNCEHLANWCVTGAAFSPQADAFTRRKPRIQLGYGYGELEGVWKGTNKYKK